MGGFNIGRRGAHPTVEGTGALVLDVNALMTPIMRSLRQHGLSLPIGQPVRLESRTWSWQPPDEPQPLAEVRISLTLGDGHAEACLSYDIDHPGGRTGPREERVSLTATPCRFGGVRWWWHCPATGRRCSKLYLPNGGLRFLSRGPGAYELDYMSHRESVVARLLRRSHRLRKKLGLAESSAEVSPPQKLKGMHWKTYLRILANVAATEAGLDRELRKLRHLGDDLRAR